MQLGKKLDAAGTFVLVNHLVPVFCSPRVSQVPLWATTLPRQPQSHRRLDVWPSQTVVSVWTRAWKSDTGALRVTFLFKVTNFGDETQLNELRFHTVTHTHTLQKNLFYRVLVLRVADILGNLRWSIHWNCTRPWCRLRPYLIKEKVPALIYRPFYPSLSTKQSTDILPTGVPVDLEMVPARMASPVLRACVNMWEERRLFSYRSAQQLHAYECVSVCTCWLKMVRPQRSHL